MDGETSSEVKNEIADGWNGKARQPQQCITTMTGQDEVRREREQPVEDGGSVDAGNGIFFAPLAGEEKKKKRRGAMGQQEKELKICAAGWVRRSRDREDDERRWAMGDERREPARDRRRRVEKKRVKREGNGRMAGRPAKRIGSFAVVSFRLSSSSPARAKGIPSSTEDA